MTTAQGVGPAFPFAGMYPKLQNAVTGLPLTCLPSLGQVDAQSGKVRAKCHVLQSSGEWPRDCILPPSEKNVSQPAKPHGPISAITAQAGFPHPRVTSV